jgi:hypothetical protein
VNCVEFPKAVRQERRNTVTVSEKATVEVIWKALETLKPAE